MSDKDTLRICKKCEQPIKDDVWYSVPHFGNHNTGGSIHYTYYHPDCYMNRTKTIVVDPGDQSPEEVKDAVPR